MTGKTDEIHLDPSKDSFFIRNFFLHICIDIIMYLLVDKCHVLACLSDLLCTDCYCISVTLAINLN